MKNTHSFRSSLLMAAALALAGGPVLAQGHGGGHFAGGGVAHGGYGGYRGGYGGRGGYGWHGGWGGWGWGGLGLGLYFASLPLYYSTLWWGGIPYYYANNSYYLYDGAARQYVTVAPPPQAQSQATGTAAVSTDLIAYPKNGQTAEQQATDKYECHRWAAAQTGFDPTLGASAANPGKRGDYVRAQSACLEGRGYSVR